MQPPPEEYLEVATRAAMRSLATVKTSDLDGLVSAEVARLRQAIHTGLTDLRHKLSRPIGRFTQQIPAARHKRDAKEQDRLNMVRDALTGLPLPGRSFDSVAALVCAAAGITVAELPDFDAIRADAETLHANFALRSATICAWVSDAIADESSGVDLDLSDVEASWFRFRRRQTSAERERDAQRAQRETEDIERNRRTEVARQAQREVDKENQAKARLTANRRNLAKLKGSKAGQALNRPEPDAGPEMGD